MKIEINITKKNFYFIMGFIAVIGIIVVVKASGWTVGDPFHEPLFTDNITSKSSSGVVAVSDDLDVIGAAMVDGSTVWHASNDGLGSGLDADKLDGLENGELDAAFITGAEVDIRDEEEGNPVPRLCVKSGACDTQSMSCVSTGGASGKVGANYAQCMASCANWCDNRMSDATCQWSCDGDTYTYCSGGTIINGQEDCTTRTDWDCEDNNCQCDYEGGSHSYTKEIILGNAWWCVDLTDSE
jgi:hypothetical protein